MREKKRNSNWELIIAGSICITISLLHLLGWLEQKWLLERISTITLLVLGLFITFLTRVLERIDYREELSNLETLAGNSLDLSKKNHGQIGTSLSNIKAAIDSLLVRDSTPGLEIRQFENVGDVYDYVSSKLRSARTSVKDITWGSYTAYKNEHESKCYENYVNTIEAVCKKGDVVYEEISSLSDTHYFDRATNLFKYYSYHLAYHGISWHIMY